MSQSVRVFGSSLQPRHARPTLARLSGGCLASLMLLARAKIVEKMIVRAAASGTGTIAVQTLTGV